MKQNNPGPDFKFYGSATIGTKGQFVVPSEARNELNFKEGDKVVIVRAHFGEGIMVIKAELFEKMIGQMQSHLTNLAYSLKSTKENQ